MKEEVIDDLAVQSILSPQPPAEIMVQYRPLYSALSNLHDLEYAALKAKFLSTESDNDICRSLNLDKEELRRVIRRAKNLVKKDLKSRGIQSFDPWFF